MYRNDLIKGEMAAQDLTVENVAVKAGISEFTVKAIRKGKTHVTIERLEKVAAVLSIPTQKLFEPKPESVSLQP